ncbi:MAG TPA: urease accessory protein UreD [Chthoniobacterales bacterium]|nr:urease accessory protein UreD [Chthoniobacterales bacterium]
MESNSTNWAAKLSLRFESRDGRTVMSERRHRGPLQVQKPLYPEGDSVCHAVIIHPPGGMAEGDSLEIHVVQEAGAKTVLCNPAASKWYKSCDRFARQNVTIQLGPGAQLDWLPQENIIFNSARVDMSFRLELADGASAAGWEMVVLGRRAMGETWDSGEFRCANQLRDLDGELLWAEKTNFTASSGIRFARQGLASFPIFGTFWAVGSKCTSQVVEDLASRLPFTDTLRAGVTCLPRRVIILRALAQKIEPLRDLMIECWSALRPVVHGRSANRLRLWAT